MSVPNPAVDWLREQPLVRQAGSVWARELFSVISDIPHGTDCTGTYCTGCVKAMKWRPPQPGGDGAWYRFDQRAMLEWPRNELPPVPHPEHDFAKGPEYPGTLPAPR